MNAFDGIPSVYFPLIRDKLLPPPAVFSDEDLAHFGGWVKRTGMRPEGAREFSLEKYPYQVELYDERRDALRHAMVIMKAAQTGLTVKLLNRAMWFCSDVRRQINVGLGFPTRDEVEKLSAGRFLPQLNTSARMIQLLRDVNRVDLRRIGISNMWFLGMSSGIAQDSKPLDVVFLDEARLVPTSRIERFLVRISESTLVDPITGMKGAWELNSTAGFPNKDIHRFFLDSTQGWWAIRCPDRKCVRHMAGIVLPREFAENPGRVVGRDDSGRYYLRCPRCGARLRDHDLQNGFYLHENPGAPIVGYQFSQLIKGEDFLNTQIMPAWERQLNLPEFYNSRLGLPYMDKEAVPASRAITEMCCDETGDYHWPQEPLGRDGRVRAMGVDQRAPEKHVVIKTLMPNGLHRVDHVRVVEASGEEAAKQLAALAVAWGVTIVVIDGEPSYDLAVMVARMLPKRMVWLQDYVQQADTIRFEDTRSDRSKRSASGEVKYEYRCLIDRYKGIDWSLGLWARRRNLLPARSNLIDGLKLPRTRAGHVIWESAAEEYLNHLAQFARLKEEKKVLYHGEHIAVPGEYVLRWRYLDYDPHFAHANLYADAGLAHLAGSSYVLGDLPVETPPVAQAEAGVPHHLRPSTLQAQAAARDTCGGCYFWDAGYCRHPVNDGANIATAESDPGCAEHSPRE